ncbi:hypothetical protein CERSUDRAFT_89468 [Gelatoporia subvermispora B]|uniref:ENTH domain-containing protein n=1 Tax=Ceriporiopsis subvermispora (strain B) TaxID=914234 RepID=M2Q2X9_CERS8|nr:hypothetical protein CERSUDRAFT_89468 [Gelatoporia subvermispora B]
MSLQQFGKGALRTAKNYTKGYSHTQTKVREATCNEPWPPSGKMMHELAQLSYNQEDFIEIMEILDKRLNDKGKNWRHVFKSLTVLDYLLHSGSENVVLYCKENLYIIKTLREFQYIDEEDRDQGANVRQKAKDIVNLLQDDSRLREQRKARAQMRERMGRGHTIREPDEPRDENIRRRSLPNGAGRNQEDEDLKRAIEESKRAVARDGISAEERDLQRAIQLSKEAEEQRAKAMADSNLMSLFDEQNRPTTTENLVDLSTPLQYMNGLQPQFTAVQPQYTQLQPQFTSLQPQFTAVQPQFTSFNPYQQQAQQEALQAQYLQQQQEFQAQQQQQELLALQQAQLQQAQQEEWLRQQQYLQQQQTATQPLPSQITGLGSNNPFAPSPTPATNDAFTRQASSPGPVASPVSFTLTGTYENRKNTASAPPAAAPREPERQVSGSAPPRADQEHAHLASLFAARGEDGVDTFGNTGQLRFYATQAGRVAAQRTGPASHNPFSQNMPYQREQPFFQV